MLRKRFPHRDKRGSFLVEVLLTIIILSVSLTLIVQSLMSSLRAMFYSAGYSRAILLAENEMFDLFTESVPEEKEIEKEIDDYHLSIELSSPDENERLKDIEKVGFQIEWRLGGRPHKIDLETYQINRPE